MKLSQFFPGSEVVHDTEFSKLGYVDSASPGVLAYADNLKYLQKAEANSNIVCLIVLPELVELASQLPGLVVSDAPREAFYKLHLRFIDELRYEKSFEPGIGANCKIHPTAIVAEGCRIEDNAVIGEQVLIRHPAWIGTGVTIEPGSKIGVEGILYNRTNKGNILIAHAGYVRIHDDVSLMTNSVIVRSVHDTDMTEVGQGSIIGLNSIVGHEAKVGQHVVVSNQCVLARKCSVGNNAFIGTNVMIKEHVRIGENSRVMAGSVVVNDVVESASVSGNFATDHKVRMLDFARIKGRH